MYGLLIFVLGLRDLLTEFTGAAVWMLILFALLGAFTLVMYDRLLPRLTRYYLWRRKRVKKGGSL